jgi:outer membrane protein assembly factor BamB
VCYDERNFETDFAAAPSVAWGMKSQFLILSTFAFVASQEISMAADPERQWPQWRGPLMTGVAPHADPPVEWSETKNIKWKLKLPGAGSSTPIVWDNYVFVQTAVPKEVKTTLIPAATAGVIGQAAPPAQGERRRRPGGGGGGPPRNEAPTSPYQFTLIAIDRSTGKAAWQKVLREEIPHEGHHRDGSFASSSPVTDGETVFAYFGSRGLYATDIKDGTVRWQKDLGKALVKNSFGEGSSPALHGKHLVVNWDHEGEDFVVTFDKSSGKEIWRKQRDEQTSWSTPYVVEHGGKAQVVVTARGKVRSYNLENGEELWSIGPLTDNVIPTAVSGHGMVYAMSGFRGAYLYAIKLGNSGDLSGTEAIAWTHNKSTPYVPSPMLYDDRLYFFAGNDARLSSLDAKTGKPYVDAERVEGITGVYASPVGAAGRVYLVGRDGGTVVLKKTDAVQVLAKNRLEDGFDASPALVGKDLFLRGKQNLYCIAAQSGRASVPASPIGKVISDQ